MHYLSRLRLPVLALAAILATMVSANASAQTIGGPSGTCGTFGFNGGSGSVTCRVDATSSLTAQPTMNTLFVGFVPSTASTQCNGRTRSGYSVQGSTSTVPIVGCAFEVTSGTVPGGGSVGDIILNLSGAGAGTSLSFQTEVCADPNCNTVISGLQTVSATVSTGGNGYFGNGNYCNGFGNGYGSNGYGDNGYGGPGRFGCGQQGYGCQNGQYMPGQPCYGYGGYLCAGQYCPGAGYTLCNGVEIPAGTYCSPSTTYTYCNGVQVPAGSYCNTTSGYTTCPDGQQVPVGSLCTSVTGSAVSYPAGWNLVGGPPGTVISGTTAALYYLPPGSSSYQTLPAGTAMQPGVGYWAYFAAGMTATLPTGSNGTVTVNLPPGQFITIGNPSNGTATVSGPAGLVVLVYSPSTGGYTQTTQLQPGQGAWAALPGGGTITITGSGGAYGPLTPPPPPPPLP